MARGGRLMPQKKDTGKRVFTGVNFDRPQHDALRALSDRTRVPLAAYLREAVDMLLAKYDVKVTTPREETLGLRRAEYLRPEHAARIRRDGNSHLREVSIHDVRAVARAVEPLRDDLLRRRLSRGDVLADRPPVVARACRALGRSAAVAARVVHDAAARHVPGVGRGRGLQERRQGERWRRLRSASGRSGAFPPSLR